MKTNDDKSKLIGERIKEARISKGISQAKLAEELGFESAVAVSLIESGKRNIDVENLQKVSDILGRDIKYFLAKEHELADVEIALRSQTDLDEDDKKAIIRFIELAKEKHSKKERK